uniref:Multiple inositol polyphosphate phosphatase 1 n=1 Tax=Podarcis muralis TaxID=64176 RepID=A0A670IBB0_PODMU
MLRPDGCLLLLLLLPLLLLLAPGPAEGEAAAERLSPYFGTKSRYEELHPELLRDPLSLGPPQPGFPLPPASCAPLQLGAVFRHGTRFPTRKQIQKLGRLHGLVQGNAGKCNASAASRLARWTMWLRPDMDGKLAPRGRRDMEMLARRLARRFPSLLARNRRFAFVSSSKHRCLDSAAAFREGLRQALDGQQQGTSQKHATTTEGIETNDKLMRFFDLCERFVKDIEDNDTAMHELDAFKEGPEMKEVVGEIANTLCLPVNDLNADLVQVAFFTCSFELAIKNISSPWCSLFSEEDAKTSVLIPVCCSWLAPGRLYLQCYKGRSLPKHLFLIAMVVGREEVLEYLNDLKQYWKRAYGYPINSRSSCILMQDIFKHLDQAVTESKRISIGPPMWSTKLTTLAGVREGKSWAQEVAFEAVQCGSQVFLVLARQPLGLHLKSTLCLMASLATPLMGITFVTDSIKTLASLLMTEKKISVALLKLPGCLPMPDLFA